MQLGQLQNSGRTCDSVRVVFWETFLMTAHTHSHWETQTSSLTTLVCLTCEQNKLDTTVHLNHLRIYILVTQHRNRSPSPCPVSLPPLTFQLAVDPLFLSFQEYHWTTALLNTPRQPPTNLAASLSFFICAHVRLNSCPCVSSGSHTLDFSLSTHLHFHVIVFYYYFYVHVYVHVYVYVFPGQSCESARMFWHINLVTKNKTVYQQLLEVRHDTHPRDSASQHMWHIMKAAQQTFSLSFSKYDFLEIPCGMFWHRLLRVRQVWSHCDIFKVRRVLKTCPVNDLGSTKTMISSGASRPTWQRYGPPLQRDKNIRVAICWEWMMKFEVTAPNR